MKYRLVLCVVLLALAGHVGAADFDAELKRLQSVLATLNQELESTYGQFQMVQEAQRAAIQQEYLAGPRPGFDNRNYDDIINAQAEARDREQELTRQMDQLLDRARDIEAQKQPILQRLYELLRSSPSTATEEHSAEVPKAGAGNARSQPKPYYGVE